MNGPEEKQTVLVVDDAPENIMVLSEVLRSEYRVTAATSGDQALKIVAGDNPPDIILLDVIMPGIDGYEVCRRLKHDPKTRLIPVVMVTTLSGLDDKVKALDAGADEFLTKPIEPPEVQARVRSLLRIKHLYDELQASYEQLKELQDLRENLTHMIVHDLRTPLSGIIGSLDLMADFGNIGPDSPIAELHDIASSSSQQLLSMINDLLDITKLESGQAVIDSKPVDLAGIVADAEAVVRPLALAQELALQSEIPADLPPLLADPEMLRRVLVNLLGNAIKFTPPRGKIKVEAEEDADGAAGFVKISVQDSGPGIPPEYHGRIFEKFGQVKNRQERKTLSTGLGLTFCKMAVEAHGGSIGVISAVGEGSTFYCQWPIAARQVSEPSG